MRFEQEDLGKIEEGVQVEIRVEGTVTKVQENGLSRRSCTSRLSP